MELTNFEWFQQQANSNREMIRSTWPEWMKSGPAFATASFPVVTDKGAHSLGDAKDAQKVAKANP